MPRYKSPYTSTTSAGEDSPDLDYHPTKQKPISKPKPAPKPESTMKKKKGNQPKAGPIANASKKVKSGKQSSSDESHIVVVVPVKSRKGKAGASKPTQSERPRSTGAPSPESQRETRSSLRRPPVKVKEESSKEDIGITVKKEALAQSEKISSDEAGTSSFVANLLR